MRPRQTTNVMNRLAILLLLLTSAPALAQSNATSALPFEFSIMPFVGYNFDNDSQQFGGALRVPVPSNIGPAVTFQPQLDVLAGGSADAAVQLDFNLVATFGDDESKYRPYAGAGFGFVASAGDISNNEGGEDFQGDSGVNLIGGVIFNQVRVIATPFVQARFSTIGPAGGDSFAIQSGLMWRFKTPR